MQKTTLELRGDTDIVISRVFRAAPRIVFDAYTKAEHVKKWWAPASRAELLECTADVRVGGSYRYVLRPKEGEAFAFSGRYREVDAPARLVYTQVFEPMAHLGEAVITVSFEADGDATRVRFVEHYPSREVRDGVIASGMEGGMRETMDQLDALVASL